MTRASELPHANIQQWEAAGAHFMEAASVYLNSCITLSSSRFLEPQDLVSRLDDQLNSFHRTLENQIRHSRSILAKMRNRLSATLYSLPEDILLEIFSVYVFGRDHNQVNDLENDVRAIYRRLYTIIGVCSVWRKFGTSHGQFWSLIPMIPLGNPEWFTQEAANLSLQRSGGRKLHLAASTGTRADPDLVEIIRHHRGRFQTVNILAQHHSLIQQLISPLAVHGVSDSLTELSLCRLPSFPPDNHFPHERDFITTTDPTDPDSINPITESLRVLRVMNIHIHWQHVSLTQLVELRIQSIMIGYNSHLYQMLLVLSSSPQLRRLEIISVTTYPTPDNDLESNTVISLQNLETFYLEDLFSDALCLVLSSIAPGSYQTSLNLTSKAFLINTRGEIVWIGHSDISGIVDDARIDTLMLDQTRIKADWVDNSFLRTTLRSLPSMTTLKLHNWIFAEADWVALTPLPISGAPTSFPQLRNIQLSKARIFDPTGFEIFVASHPVEQFVLGASMLSTGVYSWETTVWVTLDGSDPIVEWLERNVPSFWLVDGEIFEPPEFLAYQSQAQLW